MAITDYSTYKSKIASPYYRVQKSKGTVNQVSGRLLSHWVSGLIDSGAAPTTAAVPTSATTGAIGQPDSASSTLRLLWAQLSASQTGTYILCDRLSHQGGLDATLTSAQTTNLPTAALSRYTSGVGVIAAAEIYTQIGATSSDFTISYTNQAGTSGQTSKVTPIGNTGLREAQRILPIPLASGDYGVQAVASVTLSATTGTAGNFGITLFKPLMMFPVMHQNLNFEFDALLSLATQCPQIVNAACLFWLHLGTTAGATGACGFDLVFAED